MSEWIRLTPEGTETAVKYNNSRQGPYPHTLRDHDHSHHFHFSTTELANIPWVRTLVEAIRKEGSHSLAAELRMLTWSVNDDNRAEQMNEWADKIEAALKPFEDVTYE